MALNIRNKEADRLAEAIARLTGESKTEAVRAALAERLDRLRCERVGPTLVEELEQIARRCSALPRRDDRSDEEILGYDESGLPG